jgi:NAD(P)-dependent dehydrogenase (short-subunit alcohol dehydrogenase family)
MRNQGSGFIVNISSVGGRIATPFTGAYTATKFALEGLAESLRYELKKFGINVVLIEPGYIQTNFGRNVRRPAKLLEGTSAYSDLMKRSGRGHRRAFARGQQPELVARTIFRALSSKNPRLRYTAGLDAGVGVFFRRLVPERMFFWVLQKWYNLG